MEDVPTMDLIWVWIRATSVAIIIMLFRAHISRVGSHVNANLPPASRPSLIRPPLCVNRGYFMHHPRILKECHPSQRSFPVTMHREENEGPQNENWWQCSGKRYKQRRGPSINICWRSFFNGGPQNKASFPPYLESVINSMLSWENDHKDVDVVWMTSNGRSYFLQISLRDIEFLLLFQL